MARRLPLCVAALLVVSACGSDAAAPPTTTPVASAVAETSTVAVASTMVATSVATTSTFAPSTPEAHPPSTAAAPGAQLAFSGDGLGIVDFGMPADEAMRLLELEFGSPSHEVWDMYHTLYWDELCLSVLFSDDPFYRDDGVEHFVGWDVWDGTATSLRTAGGIGLGDTHAALVVAHPGEVSVAEAPDTCLPMWFVWLNDPSGDKGRRILVIFDGSPTDDASRIAGMSAGASYGC